MAKRSYVRRNAETKGATTKSKDKEKENELPKGAVSDVRTFYTRITEKITSRKIVGNIHADESDAPSRYYPTLTAECYWGRGLSIWIKFKFSHISKRPTMNELSRVKDHQLKLALGAAVELVKTFHGSVKEHTLEEVSISVWVLPYGASKVAPPIPIIKVRPGVSKSGTRAFQDPIQKPKGLSEKVIGKDLALEEDPPEKELVPYDVEQAAKAKLEKKATKKQKALGTKSEQPTPPADDQ